jgi:ABC-2 type transport system permease protein
MSKLIWFARHELRLAWRDFMWMMTAGRPARLRLALIMIVAFVGFLHLVAWATVAPYASVTFPPDRETLLVVSGSAFLAWTLMISQAMESVTRAYYARSDLDLLLSSPAPTRLIFALRTAAIGVATSSLALVLIGPFINVLAIAGGVRWLSAYVALIAMAAIATALAVGMTMIMFQWIGPKRTRFIAQVAAAIVGATFVIGVQVVSIVAYGNLSRIDAFHSDIVMNHAPGLESLAWLPARAAMGDVQAMLVLCGVAALLFGVAVTASSRRFGSFAIAAAGIGMSSVRHAPRRYGFRSGTAAAALRRKEWALLKRDPWLVSQTLMQILYLIPPAVLLWRNYGTEAGVTVMLVPVLVMAAGQLAGGLAWLAISGEDAPDLVSTAPIDWSAILRAKIEAVIGSVVIVVGPLALAVAIISPWAGAVTIVGVLIAAASSTAIQMFFRAQAKRSHFRRRQTSSRVATFAEAFSSIGWAGAAGLAAAGNAFALLVALLALLVVFIARMFRPRHALA